MSAGGIVKGLHEWASEVLSIYDVSSLIFVAE
jgi:hypothetical protein